MENKIIQRTFDEVDYYCLDITEEFVKRFGKCFAPIEDVVLIIGETYNPDTDYEQLEYVYQSIFSMPAYVLTPIGYEFPGMRFDIDGSVIDISILFKNGNMLDIEHDVMLASSSSEASNSVDGSIDSNVQEIRKVAFSHGMSGDHMLILTDAPKSAIEDWARQYNKGLEDNDNVYFKPLQSLYYVRVVVDSELDDFSWDDIQTIGYDEIYDLSDYMDYKTV